MKRSPQLGYGLLLAYCGVLQCADWLSVRGDPRQTGLQRDERVLNVRTVKKLRLLWKQRLGLADGSLTDPIMLGPIITERGVKDLVFVKDANTVYAVDADLGKIFWTRALEADQHHEERSPINCTDVKRISPVMKFSSDEVSVSPAGEDTYSDGNRPIYVIGSEGVVHVLRPSTGGDLLSPFTLVEHPALPLSLGESDGLIYAASSTNCGGGPQQVWIRNVGKSGLEIGSRPEAKSLSRIEDSAATFDWNGKQVLVSVTASGLPVLKIAASDESRFWTESAGARALRGLASWEDAASERWIYTSSAETVAGFLIKRSEGEPVPQAMWGSHGLHNSGAPIVANGVVYFLSQSGGSTSHPVLHALNAQDGNELFNSQEEIQEPSSSGNLALANGHVCFSTSKAMLQCFGLPFAM